MYKVRELGDIKNRGKASMASGDSCPLAVSTPLVLADSPAESGWLFARLVGAAVGTTTGPTLLTGKLHLRHGKNAFWCQQHLFHTQNLPRLCLEELYER